mgnify:FL=1
MGIFVNSIKICIFAAQCYWYRCLSVINIIDYEKVGFECV